MPETDTQQEKRAAEFRSTVEEIKRKFGIDVINYQEICTPNVMITLARLSKALNQNKAKVSDGTKKIYLSWDKAANNELKNNEESAGNKVLFIKGCNLQGRGNDQEITNAITTDIQTYL